jgi:hypothetical protein
MPYIGKTPSPVPIDASDIPDNSITAAKIVDGAIVAADIADATIVNLKSGRKNLIINGEMKVAQRGTSFTDPASGAYTLDRWRAGIHTSTAVGNYTQEADAPTAAEAGTNFVKCLKITCTTTDTSTAATVRYYTRYHIEGQDIAHAGFGKAGVRYMTLSFWHKHTKTGTHSFGIVSNSNDQQYVAEYTQASTDTWEKATHTFPVATAGTWATDTGNGLTLYLATHIGANYQGTGGTWGSGQAYGTANQVNNFDSTSNSMRFTGVQLELGSVATDFEHRSYGEELALCQRYYEPFGNGWTARGESSTSTVFFGRFKVSKRTDPTIGVLTTNMRMFEWGVADRDASTVAVNVNQIHENGGHIKCGGFPSTSTGNLYGLGNNSSTSDGEPFSADAEL